MGPLMKTPLQWSSGAAGLWPGLSPEIRDTTWDFPGLSVLTFSLVIFFWIYIPFREPFPPQVSDYFWVPLGERGCCFLWVYDCGLWIIALVWLYANNTLNWYIEPAVYQMFPECLLILDYPSLPLVSVLWFQFWIEFGLGSLLLEVILGYPGERSTN